MKKDIILAIGISAIVGFVAGTIVTIQDVRGDVDKLRGKIKDYENK